MGLTSRNVDILKIIVEEYLETGEVLGSKLLLKKYNLGISPATVRSDMAKLEALKLIFQPYASAGRLPTSKGLRAFVNYLMNQTPNYFLEKHIQTNNQNIKAIGDFIHNITYTLSQNTKEISFFCIPNKGIMQYSGLSHFLKKNTKKIGDEVYMIISLFEDKYNFMKIISDLPLKQGINLFIGEENLLSFLKDHTVIIKPINVNGDIGYIGLIGGLQMNYSFNISAVNGIV